MRDVTLHKIRDKLIDAIDIMDSKGRYNPEGNSQMLWDKDWNRLRGILYNLTVDIDKTSKFVEDATWV